MSSLLVSSSIKKGPIREEAKLSREHPPERPCAMSGGWESIWTKLAAEWAWASEQEVSWEWPPETTVRRRNSIGSQSISTPLTARTGFACLKGFLWQEEIHNSCHRLSSGLSRMVLDTNSLSLSEFLRYNVQKEATATPVTAVLKF